MDSDQASYPLRPPSRGSQKLRQNIQYQFQMSQPGARYAKTEDPDVGLGSPFTQQHYNYPARQRYPYYEGQMPPEMNQIQMPPAMGQGQMTPQMGHMSQLAQMAQMSQPAQISQMSQPQMAQMQMVSAQGSPRTAMSPHQMSPHQMSPLEMNPHQMNPHQMSPHGMSPHGMSPQQLRTHSSPHRPSPVMPMHLSQLLQSQLHPESKVDLQPEFHQLYPLPERPPSQNSENRKRPRADPEDSDSQLKLLALRATGMSISDLALKVKMLDSNEELSTDDILAPLNNSKDLKQDRHHQLFGMVWVQNSCEASATAVVPRNRIYARYVQLCANNNLSPLTPASFGKIIRNLFPNLKTRRLGMRGKSKYHYCGIKLVGDQSLGGSPMSTYSSGFGLDSPQSLNPHTPSFPGSPSTAGRMETPFSSAQLQELFQTSDLKYVPQLFSLIETSTDSLNQPLHLPSIYSYFGKDLDVDYDIADTLHSLYRVHCTSIFESLRYMHIKKMFALFPPFPAIFTAPVFKLLTSDQVADWVRDCDLVMYRAMLKMLTRLHLQTVPDEIMQPLKEVSREYVNKLSAVLHSKFPKPFVVMKLRLARQFTLILKRLIRCIETGTSALRVLSNPTERTLMLNDWLRLDMHEIVLREVPCAHENVESLVGILNDQLLKLFSGDERESPGLARYAAFLLELPSKFPKVNPWLFSLVCSNLLTTCLREMSLNGGQSFGSWWILRCWVDEYISWCFELGGFLYEEFQSDFEQSLKHDDFPEPTSANASSSFEANTSDQLRTASFVDLLDGLYGDSKTEGDWL